MKKRVLKISLSLVMFFAFATNKLYAATRSESTITIGTYNINSGYPQSEERVKEMNRRITENKIDILAAQEVDINAIRTEGKDENNKPYKRNIMEELGVGYKYLNFAKMINIAGRNAEYGIASISNKKRISSNNYMYENQFGEERGYQVNIYYIDGSNVAIFNTHLTHENEDVREKQMSELKRAVDNEKRAKYKIIMGDLNTRTSGLGIDTFTNDARYDVVKNNNNWIGTVLSNKAVDYIIHTTNMSVKSSKVVSDKFKGEILSDHHLLLATFSISQHFAEEENGELIFSLDRHHIINHARRTAENENTIFEYYPNTVYGNNHGSHIKYIFFLEEDETIRYVLQRKDGERINIKKIYYYPNTVYGDKHWEKIDRGRTENLI